MNKKLLFGVFAAATMMFATSCSNDELDSVQSVKKSVVSFTLEQPGIATRAYADGLKANTLTYAVYEAGSTTPVQEGEGTFTDKTATVSIELTTGKSYDLVFWADAENSPYEFQKESQSIKVNYDNLLSQDENRDAFFAAEKGLFVDGTAISKTITLTRPFAQLNIGTIGETVDYTMKSSVKVSNVYETLNLLTGEVSDPLGEKTFGLAKIPDSHERFPIAGVKYLSMNYLLVNGIGEPELINIEFATDNNVTIPVTDVPVKNNYRTNIYGRDLLQPTPDKVTAELTIEIDVDSPNLENTECAHEAVNLGLSSGTLWATANIGSKKSEWLGFYFAWGETGQEKPSYNWTSYAHYTSNGDDATTLGEEMNKYTTPGGTLESVDDAATARWGTEWRMPTKEEFEELIAECDWTWDATRNGYVICSKTNSNSIFLPGTAYKDDSKILGKESNDIMYWTSTLGTNVLWAHYLEGNVEQNCVKIEGNQYVLRKCGLQIRPVKKQ